MNLLDIDAKLLHCLQESEYFNIDYNKIAKRLRVDKKAVRDSVSRLKHEGFITGPMVPIDAEKLGFITAFITFRCVERSEKVLLKLGELIKQGRSQGFTIQEAFLVTGDSDLQLKVKVKGVEGYKEFVKLFEKKVAYFGYGSGSIAFQKIHEQPILDAIQ